MLRMINRLLVAGLVALTIIFATSSHVRVFANAAPVFSYDGLINDILSGWAYDPDAPSASLRIDTYFDGPAGSTTVTYGMNSYANLSRPDVNAAFGITGNHGYNIQIPASYKDGRQHTAYLYAIDTAGGVNPQIKAVTFTLGGTGAPTTPPTSNYYHPPVYNNGLEHADLTWIDRPDYSVGFDRNTGAIYKYINRRSDPNKNLIYDNLGAALQLAVFYGQNLVTGGANAACSKQGFWNPTQGGAACSYKNGKVTIDHFIPKLGPTHHATCDGVQNDACTQAQNTLNVSQFQMYNFDYGPGYEGPYNPKDTLYMKQDVTAKDKAVVVDYSVVNKGGYPTNDFSLWA